jgi:hypothetical protein
MSPQTFTTCVGGRPSYRSMACLGRSPVARVRIPYAPPQKSPAQMGFFASSGTTAQRSKGVSKGQIGARLARAPGPFLRCGREHF